MNTPIKINLYNGAYETLHNEMKLAGFEFKETHLFNTLSPQQIFELVGSIPPELIAAVIGAWVNSKVGRKITVKDGEKLLEIKGKYSEKEIENAIKGFNEISVIESSSNE